MYDGIPVRVNICSRQAMTVDVCMFGQGIAKGYLEYSSTTMSMYTLPVEDASGPLKSMLRRSKGRVALISVLSDGQYNCGFNSAQTLHVARLLNVFSCKG